MDQLEPLPRRRFTATLLGALGVQAFATVAFLIQAAVLLGECSRDASIAQALFFAVLLDVLLVVVFAVRWRDKVSVTGLLLGMVPGVVLVVLAGMWMNASISGCPV